MRVVYRGLAVVAAVAAAAATLIVVLPSEPDEVAAGPVTAPPAAPPSSGSSTAPASAVPSPGPSAGPSSGPSAVSPSASPTGPDQAGGGPTPNPGTSLAPGYTAMEALYADPRVPRLTGEVKRMNLPAPSTKVVGDRRTGLAAPRLPKPWKTYRAAPFTTRQMLPPQRGTSLRGMFVTCPLPIMEQESPRDTALLAARWTLNHHPDGSKIHWLASQPVKRGWMLVYQITYGRHSSRAAVVVMDGGMSKPGLAFVTMPDSQRKQWHEIGRVVSGVRVLG